MLQGQRMCRWSVGVLPSQGMFLLRPSCARPESLQMRRRRERGRSTCPRLSLHKELHCLPPRGGQGFSGQGRGVWPPPHSSTEQETHPQEGVFPDQLVPTIREGQVLFDLGPPLPPCAILDGSAPVPHPRPDTVPPPLPCSASSPLRPTAGTSLCREDPLAPPPPPQGQEACNIPRPSPSLRLPPLPPQLVRGDYLPPPAQPLLVARDFLLPPDSPHLQEVAQPVDTRQVQVPRRLKLLLG